MSTPNQKNSLNRSLFAALSVDTLLEKAVRQTGLTDFGGDAFLEPLGVLLESLREEAGLSALGAFIMSQTVLRLLTNRLLIEKAFADDPSMDDTPIERPLYVLGFPRTGTTFLHNLLACDPNARWLHLWEGLYPAPSPRSLVDDPRIEQVEKWVAAFEKAAPRLPIAHKLEPRGPEECFWLMEHTFADLIFELRAYVPGYAKWLTAHEADVDIYRYYRRQLQMLGTHCRGRHWVLKAPRHLPGLAGLLAVFPDARIVQTHRDPAAVLPSLCSLCEILHSAVSDKVDKHAIGAHWSERLKWNLQKAREIRAGARPEQFFDVRYEDLVATPIATVARIYDYHGYEYTSRFEANMRSWLTGNRQHKHGVHRYTLEEYGIDVEQCHS
ncbi:MAG: sulfotransferase [Gammaproteobacteria bacterium]|nr:sulfotransferase [Gammaproteobacteria bacterium]